MVDSFQFKKPQPTDHAVFWLNLYVQVHKKHNIYLMSRIVGRKHYVDYSWVLDVSSMSYNNDQLLCCNEYLCKSLKISY